MVHPTQESPQHPTPSQHWTRVIVLLRASAESRGDGLDESLKWHCAQRDWFPIQQFDPHLAMAELCLREKAQQSRAAWGLQRMERIALLIVEPEHWPQSRALADAVRRYLPAAEIWALCDGELQPLAPQANETEATQATTHAVPASAEINAAPNDAPCVVRNGRSVLTAHDADEPGDPRRLTREEIEMLLAPDLEPRGGGSAA